MDIEFIEGNQELLDWISPLWAQLNTHHRRKSRNFVAYYSRLTFQQRKTALLAKAQHGLMRVDLVKLKDGDDYIAYSVTTISEAREGELESLFVSEPYRKNGIGQSLVQRSLDWMDRHNISIRRVTVAGGNEDALPFYQKFGFFTKLYQLEQVDQTHVIPPEEDAKTKNASPRSRKKKQS